MSTSKSATKRQWNVEVFDADAPGLTDDLRRLTIAQIADVYKVTQLSLPVPASKIAIEYLGKQWSGFVGFPLVSFMLALLINTLLSPGFKGWYDILFLGVLTVVLDTLVLRGVVQYMLYKYAYVKYGELVSWVQAHDFSQEKFAESNNPKDNNYCLIVRDAERDGLVISVACLRAKEGEANYDKTVFQKKGECMLARVGTLPAYQRQGLSTAILRECVRKARSELQCHRMWLQTTSSQQPAILMYEANGFKLFKDTDLKYGVFLKSFEMSLK